ncbi:hypothetical protein FQA47_000033 [Oryzias melastigma]|uniref:Uncharacterized protein n=1 Tax=Oryzias melastigma TaxID=30732 RepID=A0A834CQ72_ORYME|nr:hypothetical protein FQA47_000033 [Oryzias melastigma]
MGKDDKGNAVLELQRERETTQRSALCQNHYRSPDDEERPQRPSPVWIQKNPQRFMVSDLIKEGTIVFGKFTLKLVQSQLKIRQDFNHLPLSEFRTQSALISHHFDGLSVYWSVIMV